MLSTPAGEHLVPGGATFRVRALRATAAHLSGNFDNVIYDQQTDDRPLSKAAEGLLDRFPGGSPDGDH
jgi:hypothetical protein